MTSASPDSPRLGPVQAQERVILLDVLRGVAILGMFYQNFRVGGIIPTTMIYGSGFQSAVATALDVLVRWKFQALFALLMGVGMAVQVERAESRGVDVFPMYLRRLAFLFVLSALMAVVVSSVSYLKILAVTGLVALFIAYPIRKRTKLLLLLIVWMFVGSTTQSSGYLWDRPVLSPEVIQERTADAQNGHERLRAEATVVQSPIDSPEEIRGNLSELFSSVPSELSTLEDLIGEAVGLLPVMLLGFLFWQMGVYRKSWEHRRFFALLLVIAGGIGLASSLVAWDLSHKASLAQYGLAEPFTLQQTTVLTIFLGLAIPGLVLTYVSLVALLLSVRWPAHFLKNLAPAGRMAFTNYVLHWMLPPVFFPLLFGWWLPEHGPAQEIVRVTIAFILLVIFSTWWLKRFRFGPFEWLWRTLTYWKLQPMRVEAPAART